MIMVWCCLFCINEVMAFKTVKVKPPTLGVLGQAVEILKHWYLNRNGGVHVYIVQVSICTPKIGWTLGYFCLLIQTNHFWDPPRKTAGQTWLTSNLNGCCFFFTTKWSPWWVVWPPRCNGSGEVGFWILQKPFPRCLFFACVFLNLCFFDQKSKPDISMPKNPGGLDFNSASPRFWPKVEGEDGPAKTIVFANSKFMATWDLLWNNSPGGAKRRYTTFDGNSENLVGKISADVSKTLVHHWEKLIKTTYQVVQDFFH